MNAMPAGLPTWLTSASTIRTALLVCALLLVVVLLVRLRRRRAATVRPAPTPEVPTTMHVVTHPESAPPAVVPELPETSQPSQHSEPSLQHSEPSEPSSEPSSDVFAPVPPAPVQSVPVDAHVPTAPSAAPSTAPSTAAGYAALSRTYAAQGRLREAALAQWAADLRVLGGLLEGRGTLLSTAQGHLPAGETREAVAGARRVAAELAVGTDGDVHALLFPLDHLVGPDRSTLHEAPERHGAAVLLDHARDRMVAAERLAELDPTTAAAAAREAELAAFEALLVESALTYGDTDLVSVGLRLDLAHAALADSDRGAPASALPVTVARTREVLHGVVAEHERETLAVAFAPAPTA